MAEAVPITDRVSGWVRQQVFSRRGPLTPPLELEYRHIFVLPTVFGSGFGVMLVFMALGGLNFNNNLALMLVFLLGAIAAMTTLLAYRNLNGLRVDGVNAEPVFCGEDAHFRVFVRNGNERQRPAIQAGFRAQQDCLDLELGGSDAFGLSCPTEKRGWLDMPSFRLETRFPLGMFKAWSWVLPQTRCLVYPTPARNAPPLPRIGHGQLGRADKGEGDQIHGLRKYRPGDSKQRIAWRASARHEKFYSLEMETPRESACELDWDLLHGADLERRLSILTAWVVAADHKQLAYSLKLPDIEIQAGSGIGQRMQCLEALALYRL
jgi:uncharacterized protein (DUF58 family)